MPLGRHSVLWAGTNQAGRLQNGVYFVRLQSGGRSLVKRVVLMR